MGYFFQILLVLVGVWVSTLSLLLVLKLLFKIYDAVIRWTIRRKIRKDPLIGDRQVDTFVYDQKGYRYHYRLTQTEGSPPKTRVVWLSRLTRTNPAEKRLSHFHQLWEALFYGANLDTRVVIGALVASIALCVAFLTSLSTKEALLTEIVMRVTGIPDLKVKSDEKGKLRISGQQRLSGGGKAEPFNVVVDPIEWVFSGKPAYVTRYAGGQPVTYEVYHDGKGNVALMKDGHRIVGHPQGDKIVWHGEGVEGKVTEVDIPNEAELRKMISEHQKGERQDAGKSSDSR